MVYIFINFLSGKDFFFVLKIIVFVSTREGSGAYAAACQKIQDSLTKYLEEHPISDDSDEEEGENIPSSVLGKHFNVYH